MSAAEHRKTNLGDETGGALATFLTVLAVAGLGLGIVAGLYLILWTGAEYVTFGMVLAALGCMVAGGAGACLLWAAARIVRTQQEVMRVQRKMLAVFSDMYFPEPKAAAPAPPPPPAHDKARDDALLDGVLRQLRQLNANFLLTPDQLEEKRGRQRAIRADELASQCRQSFADGQLAEARRILDELEDLDGDENRVAELRRLLADARAQVETEETQRETRHVEDLMALADYAGAEQAAAALGQRYPDSPAATAVLQRVRLAWTAFQQQRRRELYAEVERHAERRRWRDAVAAARKLLDAHPESPEAGMVLPRMATLEDNARIQEVRGLRDRIRDLIERRRYLEAIEVGRDVVDRFPDTQAAADLRRQLPRLAELAQAGQTGSAGDTGVRRSLLTDLATADEADAD